jgi:hypothetical protein
MSSSCGNGTTWQVNIGVGQGKVVLFSVPGCYSRALVVRRRTRGGRPKQNSTGSSDTNSTEQTSTIASNGSAATTTVDDTEVANSSDNMTVNGSMPSNETSGSTDGQSTSGSKSDVQHCLHEAGCLEFRGHRAVCQLTNEQNCESLFQGEYGQGPCPADLFDEQKSTNTSCGLTITFS